MEIKHLIGHWKSQDFPPFIYKDEKEIILNISGTLICTLWIRDQKNNPTLSEGIVSINQHQHDNFEILINGTATDAKFLNLSARMHISSKPASMVIEIPEYGERYFEKLE